MSVLCLEVLMALQYSQDKTLSLFHVINGDKYALVYFPPGGLGKFGTFGNENKVLPNEGQM